MIMEASITMSNKNGGQQTPLPNESEKTCRLKGMDSSESHSDEEEATGKAADMAQAQPQAQKSEFLQDMDPSTGASQNPYEYLKGQVIRDSQRKSAFQKFKDHSKRAIKKTVASFICLSFMLLLSFVLSTYEYNQVHTQYQRVYDDVARKLSDNDLANQSSNLLANNTQVNHANSNASVALGQVNATSLDHDSSQSEEETSKRMKGS